MYTLKVRRDYYYRAFVCLFSFFRRSLGRRVALFVVISLSLARVVGPEELCCWLFFWSRSDIIFLFDDFLPSL